MEKGSGSGGSQRFVAKSGPRNRIGRIFIDTLRKMGPSAALEDALAIAVAQARNVRGLRARRRHQ